MKQGEKWKIFITNCDAQISIFKGKIDKDMLREKSLTVVKDEGKNWDNGKDHKARYQRILSKHEVTFWLVENSGQEWWTFAVKYYFNLKGCLLYCWNFYLWKYLK